MVEFGGSIKQKMDSIEDVERRVSQQLTFSATASFRSRMRESLRCRRPWQALAGVGTFRSLAGKSENSSVGAFSDELLLRH